MTTVKICTLRPRGCKSQGRSTHDKQLLRHHEEDYDEMQHAQTFALSGHEEAHRETLQNTTSRLQKSRSTNDKKLLGHHEEDYDEMQHEKTSRLQKPRSIYEKQLLSIHEEDYRELHVPHVTW